MLLEQTGKKNGQPCKIFLCIHDTFTLICNRQRESSGFICNFESFFIIFSRPEHKSYLSLLTVFAFMIIGVSRGSRLRRVQTMCVNLALCCAYLCRVAQGSLIFPYKSFLSSR